jgi:NAD(P)-dependent dehydrogenase (short-subunit alcohol dehydrogenase family)
MQDEFAGKAVFITGGGGGIGAATGRTFASMGALVVLADANLDAAEAAAADILATGGIALATRLDVTDETSCAEAVAFAQQAHGDCHVLVNNAGVLMRDSVDDPTVTQTMKRTFEINVLGMAAMTLAVIPQLRRTKGAVVNLASIGSFVSAGTGLSYGPSKAAVKLLTQTLAQQLAPDGIRVNAVAPGPVMTSMTQNTRENPERSHRLVSRTLMNRYADPSEIARPIVFLASDAASFITGTTLAVDGGYLTT